MARRTACGLLSSALLCLYLAVTAQAQVAAKEFKTAGSAREPVISLDTHVVSLTVTVTDKQGRHLSNLDRSAFTVFEDQVAQEITFFNHADAPASVAIVFDLSGSMREEKIARAKLALERFLPNCHPADEFSLIGFNDRAWLALDKTRDGEQLLRQFSSVKPQGNTALFDAVALGLTHLERAAHQRRVLLVVSDGEDNRSRVSLGQVKRMAQESAALVYAIGITDFFQRRSGGGLSLSELAEQTGGKAYFPGNGEALSEAFEKIALELRQQYSLGYTPSHFISDGRWRRLKVKVTPPPETPKIVVRSRPGYYAKPGVRSDAVKAEN
jgi:Ca-activated chloride channel family protein